MAYTNLPGVRGSYSDGSLRSPTGSTQPRILVIGTASSGHSDEPYLVTNAGQAEDEFGSSSELMKGFHEAFVQGADNIAVLRTGGKTGSFVLTDSTTATLTIVPELKDAEVLERYALVMDGSGASNRIVIYDIISEEYVYDSEDLLVLDEGQIEITDTGIDLFSVGTLGDPTTYTALADLVTGDFTAEGTATVSSVTKVAGADGVSVSLAEKYAALNTSYHQLDFRDADMVVPVGVHIDEQNAVDGDTANFFKGVPVAGASNDTLGYVWEYIYKGKLYTYMVDKATYFTDEGSANEATLTFNTDLVATAVNTGTGGNSITVQVNASGSAGPTVTITEPTATTLHILITDDGSSTTSATVTAANTALGLFTLANGKTGDEIVVFSGGGATTLTTVASTPLATGAGAHVLTHVDLTGETVPAAVSTRFAAGEDAELREVNFAHQLASFCRHASVNWKAMIGSISFKAPTAYTRSAIASWVGSGATYSTGPDGSQLIIDAPADNGSAILGNKFLAGKAASGGGYRNAQIVGAASAVDGLAFGGFIKTVGASLPNYNDFPDHSYGVSDGDEALDGNKKPIDLGKHIFVTYDFPIHRNSFNGGSRYRGAVNITLLGVLAKVPENIEPINEAYPLRGISAAPRVHATQMNQLAKIRTIGLRLDPDAGYLFTKVDTAAHPDSDYAMCTTIRSVNRHLQGVRRIAKKYLGKDYSSQRIIALDNAIKTYLNAEKVAGFNGGAKCTLSFTRQDKILGRINIALKIVPPFSIRAIEVNLSVAADETEL